MLLRLKKIKLGSGFAPPCRRAARAAVYAALLLLAAPFPVFSAPDLLTPQNTVYISSLAPTFGWSPTTPNYQLQVDNNSDFSSPAIDIVTANIFYTAPAALAHGVTYYWHVKDSAWSGSYTFIIDTSAPAAAAYGHISSTGGFLSESQFNTLLAGVTVQLNMQDALAGLAVTTGAYPAGGHGVIYSVDAGNNWADISMAVSFDGAQEYINSLAVYNGKLYAGQGSGLGNGDVYVFDGNTWSLSYDGAQEYIYSLAVYDGKLYAGQGYSAGDGDVYVFDGVTWAKSFEGAQEYISSLAVYNGKLYAGQGSGAGDGDVYVFDGATWTKSFEGAQEYINSLAVYNGKLYAGQGASTGDGDIYVFDGNTWAKSFEGAQEYINSLAVYNGKLYAGQGASTGDGDIYVFDGNTWSLSYNGAQEIISSLAVYNGKLYAGQGLSAGDGDIYVFDGNTWSLSFDGAQDYIFSLAVYNGKLYAGQGLSTGDGDVLAFSPVAVSSSTGADGSTGLETLSASLSLAASTNTQTCGGAVPCGATNQVKFFGTDLAGNVKMAGPYAVITYQPEPSAAEVAAFYSTGAWLNASSITFTSGFMQALYYRYAWDNSPAHVWNFSETVWSGTPSLGLEFSGDGAWYLHLLPYNLFDSSGTPADIGPFNVDRAIPAAASYGHISSTGGFLSESQFNSLLSGVTVQLNMQDALAGLAVTTAAYPSGGHGILYSIDAGNSWADVNMEVSFNGAQEYIHSLVVYNGKLYAGQGFTAGDGDVYVYDGNTWTKSFEGAQENIRCLAVYNGKLYAGQGSGTGDGDVYVFDGATWAKSFEGAQENIYSLAVYDGKLYAGQGLSTGDGDIYVFDGNTWSLSYDGAQEYIYSLAVYNGKLYAGQGSGAGDGDVYVYDGITWTKSFEGAQEYIQSLAVYNGKLYAGQGNGAGDGDVYVFDGVTWTKSFEGAQEQIISLAVYNGKLYAGQGSATGDGDIYVFDGNIWNLSYDGAQEFVLSLAVYNGKLYAGQGGITSGGDVLAFSPIALSSSTGADGSTGPEVLSANLSLSASTNTQTCGGAVPCGASNQIKFFGTDLAGNVKMSGPYAVITYQPEPSAAEVATAYSTGAWLNASSITFTSGFTQALYYRYAWDNSPTHTWDFSETVWPRPAPLGLEFAADGAWYLHVLPYNLLDSSGTPVDIGPFNVDRAIPAAASYGHISSTGGFLSESQFNSLLTGVTVQLNMQDALAGLAVTTGAYPAGGHGVIYSMDAGKNWSDINMEVSFDGAQDSISALAVYNGRLYAGHGNDAGEGDVYSFDGNAWRMVYNGAQEYINSLAVYNGKLYAGQGINTGDGDIYVFDGNTWTKSFEGAQESIYSLAVYNGKLYAGQGYSAAGDGDIYVFDGNAWSLSFDGAQEAIYSLVVYNGKLYAGQGYNAAGDGDIYVFDGNTWSLSYDGAQERISSLSVYNGKLYAGQGSGTGDADVYVFDGNTWSLSYDGAGAWVESLAAYNGKLYAGLGNDIYSFDGNAWNFSYGNGPQINSLAVYNGKLYAGQGINAGEGDVLAFSPVAVSSSTGADGSTGLETLSASLSLLASTNTQTCGGAAPCGATNQVKFFGTDLAGNVKMAGPYAVITYQAEPSAAEVTATYSTGAWLNASSITFTSGFNEASYYRYAWDNSPAYAWNLTETVWSPGPLGLEFAADGAWYLHVLPYNILGSSGTPVDIGPFNVDRVIPAAAAYGHISSTGGFLSESQFDSLQNGVTVQVNIQDALAGLAITTGAYPAGGHSVMYSINAGKSWTDLNMALGFDGLQESISSLAVYDGKLYAGQGDSAAGDGDVYVFNGNTWSLSFDGAQEDISSLAVYNGKLYAGLGGPVVGNGDVYVFDGNIWRMAHNGAKHRIYCLTVYNGKLYAGQGSNAGDGDVSVFDGNTWSLSFDGAQERISSLSVYNGKLYAGQGSNAGDGDVYVFDGNTWSLSFDGAQEDISSLAVYNGKLYAGQGSFAGDGDVYVFDGNTWSLSYDGSQEQINSLVVYNGKLYAGQGSGTGDGSIYDFDGNTWSLSFDGAQEYIYSLAVYNGKLYAGQGSSTGDGDVLAFSPVAVSSSTGADGATGPELLSVNLDLAASTNTQTCGGAAPCGATNQVKFFGTDLAGNVKTAGPYALLVYRAEPSAAEVVATYSTGAWLNASSITFTSYFREAAYYRYVWDNAPGYSWNFTETVWSPGPLGLEFPADGAWYLHVLPYNILDSSGAPVDIGPFNVDRAIPAAASYGHISSTGGFLSESQFNTLLSGVTVQINVQDALAGLAVTTAAYPAGGHGILYSRDAGKSWMDVNMALSFDGAQEHISSLAVYNGKLYAGQGYDEGDGDVYVFDGAAWSLSYDGAQQSIQALAVYNGKLYAGQGNDGGGLVVFDGAAWTLVPTGDLPMLIYALAVYNSRLYAGVMGGGDVYVYDGVTWSRSFDGAQECVHSLAVYNGKLYAGQGYSAGDGDVYVFDGNTWSLSFDGAKYAVYSLTVYNGKLYAGLGGIVIGDGDVYVFDGNAWSLSFDGEQKYIYALAAYNGKLYAGQAYAGDLYVFDGNVWSLPYDRAQRNIEALAVYNGKLYAGVDSGDVVSFSPPALSSVSGADGSTGPELLSVNIDLAASTNTQTCGGAAPCGATNQVKFFGTDLAGNVKMSGPYAVLAYGPEPSTAEVVATYSTGAWVNASSIAFSSGFQLAAYYRYVWDNSPAYAWSLSETVWSAGSLGLQFAADGPWYLHVLPYNLFDSSGTPADIGPFNVDRVIPAAASYGHISSTGGFLSESQFDPLLSGVTVQISMQDALAGLAITTEAYPAGGHGVLYSIDAGASWAAENMALSFDGAESHIGCLAVYNGKLYAGQGGGAGDGDVYAFDGVTWNLSFDGAEETIESLAVYNNRLYAGQGSGAGDGDIYVFDGAAWAKSFDGVQESIESLAVYNGKLYAGQGYSAAGDGDIYVFDGNTWSLSYDGAQEGILALAVYNGKLYAGQSDDTGDGDIYVYDGNTWTLSFNGSKGYIFALAVYNGKLYAGQGYGSSSGDIYVFDGNTWSLSFDGVDSGIFAFSVYNGKLYAGQGGVLGTGDIYVYDGSSWRLSFGGGRDRIMSLAAYDGKLYAGQGFSSGSGKVLAFSPLALSSSTGADGSTGQEVLSAALNLAVSTNTQTCGGAAPCGATNQVRFFGTDRAGNVKMAGPYAVVTYMAEPSAADITAVYSTGAWLNAGAITFASGFQGAAYYRYAWDNSPAYAWTFSEPFWNPGPLAQQFGADGPWYLHALPYNVFGSSGAPVDLGPFNEDRTAPSASSFVHVNSTGGALAEAQYNDLLSGVTVQLKVRDLLAGLLVSDGGRPEVSPVPPGGYGVRYSADAGQTWAAEKMSLSFSGGTDAISCLTVYDGKLYAGTGDYYYWGDGDVYVFDGAVWSRSFDGETYSIKSLAVYDGKLYAGQLDDSKIYVFDGNTWSLSLDLDMYGGVWAMAVYGGKLYAGVGYAYADGDGDVYVFDGETWRLSFDGAQERITSLAVYNGKLYAGQAEDAGDGDIYVFDGNTWTKSFDGAQEIIMSLAVYNGKLYAGQGEDDGDGDIYVFDGNIWSLSYDGPLDGVASLAAHKGWLYAGFGDSLNEGFGDIYSFDGAAWRLAHDGSNVSVRALAAYDGGLYAGQYSWDSGFGQVHRLSQPAALLTGQDGTTGEETLSAVLDLAISTNTQACGGAAPCAATNQVVFSATDKAGNVVISGPYAVITAPPPGAGDITPDRVPGAWYNTSTFTFSSAFPTAAYYRCAWDNAATHEWSYTEPQWLASSGAAAFEAAVPGADHYLHVLPYSSAHSSGAPRHIGPFRFESAPPAAADFASVSSTGGFMSESQVNDLATGVTVRLKVQDLLSGLAVSADAAPGDTPAPAGGYGVRYSTDAGKTWLAESPALSFDGRAETVWALAVYNGKLYAGQGSNYEDGQGDVYAYDGAVWTPSFNGRAAITALAVYDGKLYAAHQGDYDDDGVVYVFDGASWDISYAANYGHHMRALAVYNGKLYGAQCGENYDDGDIYEFDGKVWRLSFDGEQAGFSSLAVYNGRLYAGQGFDEIYGPGDVYVFDGNTWNLSFNGEEVAIRSLAVYNGKLYAGQYGWAPGDGDIYVFDGGSWAASLAGPENGVASLAAYKGWLYAGFVGDTAGQGDLYAFDGAAWRSVYSGSKAGLQSLAVYDGRLYGGQTGSIDPSFDGDVLRFSPVAVSTFTGPDGSTGQEVLSAALNLAASTNTQTCGGSAPCGATNQVIFSATDRAGSVVTAGPYAVRAAPPLSADDVLPARSTGVWYNSSTFTFASAFVAAAYYRYVWDNSSSRVWNYGEALWLSSSAVLDVQGLAGNGTWYLHVLPYSAADSPGGGRDIGPFLFDGTAPAADAFLTFNSTGGAMSEAMFNNLFSGVTAQLTVQDALSGLSAAYFNPAAPGLPPAGRGFEDGALGGQWATGGGAPWYVQASTVNSGSYAARAGAIENGAVSYMQFTAEVAGDGEVSFFRKVDAEYGDYLIFSIDGIDVDAWNNSVPWGKVSYPVTAGSHVFRWEYAKDMWESGLSDTAWVDDIEYPAAWPLVQYSSTTGNTWAAVPSSSTVSRPYIELTGAEGSVTAQTFSVYGLDLAYSTRTAVCAGAVPCDSTNQVRFIFSDRAGNVRTAGPYAILVDTAPVSPITDLSTAAVYQSSITLTWTAPADAGPGVGAVTTGWYRIDYATYPEYEFSPAVYKVEFPTVALIGEQQSFQVQGLCPYTTYYFSVYAGDRAYVFSGPSNVAVFEGLPTEDCGFRVYDGESVVALACEFPPGANSKLRIFARGKVYGLVLLEPTSPCALSRMRIQTGEGVRAVKKYQ